MMMANYVVFFKLLCLWLLVVGCITNCC